MLPLLPIPLLLLLLLLLLLPLPLPLLLLFLILFILLLLFILLFLLLFPFLLSLLVLLPLWNWSQELAAKYHLGWTIRKGFWEVLLLLLGPFCQALFFACFSKNPDNRTSMYISKGFFSSKLVPWNLEVGVQGNITQNQVGSAKLSVRMNENLRPKNLVQIGNFHKVDVRFCIPKNKNA